MEVSIIDNKKASLSVYPFCACVNSDLEWAIIIASASFYQTTQKSKRKLEADFYAMLEQCRDSFGKEWINQLEKRLF